MSVALWEVGRATYQSVCNSYHREEKGFVIPLVTFVTTSGSPYKLGSLTEFKRSVAKRSGWYWHDATPEGGNRHVLRRLVDFS